MFFNKLYFNPTAGEVFDYFSKIVKISGESVHTMDDNGVSFSDEFEHGFELGAIRVSSTDLVLESPMKFFSIELPACLLVNGADSDVSDSLTIFHF